jgi:hypothetical protein
MARGECPDFDGGAVVSGLDEPDIPEPHRVEGMKITRQAHLVHRPQIGQLVGDAAIDGLELHVGAFGELVVRAIVSLGEAGLPVDGVRAPDRKRAKAAAIFIARIFVRPKGSLPFTRTASAPAAFLPPHPTISNRPAIGREPHTGDIAILPAVLLTAGEPFGLSEIV